MRLLLLVTSHPPPLLLGHQPSGRWGVHQSDERAVVGGGQATGVARARSIAQACESLGSEALQATPHRLGTAVQFGSTGVYAGALPTGHDHPSLLSPIRRPMSTGGQFANGARFLLVP